MKDPLILRDNPMIKHDRLFRMKVMHVAISSAIHFSVTLNSVSPNEFIHGVTGHACSHLSSTEGFGFISGWLNVLRHHVQLASTFKEEDI